MCYGNPAEMPLNFVPQIPQPDQITPCNGLGMGFTLRAALGVLAGFLFLFVAARISRKSWLPPA